MKAWLKVSIYQNPAKYVARDLCYIPFQSHIKQKFNMVPSAKETKKKAKPSVLDKLVFLILVHLILVIQHSHHNVYDADLD